MHAQTSLLTKMFQPCFLVVRKKPINIIMDVQKMEMNKFTGQPFSAKYWQILEKRKKLPVWDYHEQFIDMVKKHQFMVLIGETGSGKTTQARTL